MHFSLNKFNMPGVMAACEEVEAALAEWKPRAHWGKLHHMGATELAAAYGADAIERFRGLCARHDPAGKFRNAWFERLIFGDAADHLELIVPAAPTGS